MNSLLIRLFKLFGSTALLLLTTFVLFAQDFDDEEYYERMLTEEVEVENPVYKPVLSLGTGVIHYMGDIRYPGNNPLLGNLGYRGTVSTMFGRDNHYKLNIFFLYGAAQGHDFKISRAMQADPTLFTLNENAMPIAHNSSFRSTFYEFGLSVEYGFGHWLGRSRRFRPFVSVGISPLPFTLKGNVYKDKLSGDDGFYHFWNDGTMRDIAETDPASPGASIITFDKEFETDLAKADFHNLGKYTQTTVVYPVEVGFDFYLSYRVFLRVSSSLHYTLTDMLDNYNDKVAQRYGLKGKGYHDMFLFNSFSLSFDLFSDPEMMKVDMLFAEIEDVDYEVMFADQDMDGVFDWWDLCPDTPTGVEVDSVGCPLDSDGDGIPDFMDNEPNTPFGVIVSDRGVQLSADQLADMFERPTAVRREEIKLIPPAPIWTRSIAFTKGEMPQKYRRFDLDGDGYISFEELLRAIGSYFDGTLDFTTEEIYELNNYFFSQ